MKTEIFDVEESEAAPLRPRIESVRAALVKVAAMLQEDWFFDEVAEALANGCSHEGRLICKESSKGYVVAFGRCSKSKLGDNSFIRLDLE